MWTSINFLLQQDPFLPTGPSSALGTVVESPVGAPVNVLKRSLSGGIGSRNNPLVDPANFNFMELINTLIAYAFLFVFAISVVFVFWGGITFILSGGQEEKVKNAVNTIRYAIIGLLVAIFSFAIVAWIGKQFNLDLIQYIRPENIIDSIKRIFE